MSSYFSKHYGLLCVKKDRYWPEENSILWSLQYLLLDPDFNNVEDVQCNKWIEDCKTHIPGLYHQRPVWRNTGNKEDYHSPDQLLALCGLVKEEELQVIWFYLKSHYFTYDNMSGKVNFKRLMQPSVIFYIWALATDNKLAKFLLTVTSIISCLAPKNVTSGKLKAFTMLSVLNMDKTLIFCGKLAGGWTQVFQTYYKPVDHPLHLKDYKYYGCICGHTWKKRLGKFCPECEEEI